MNSNTQHTPGPWEAGKAFDPSPYHLKEVKAIAAHGHVIAHVNTAWMSRSDADARLIAAAPDLLAALRDILEGKSFDMQPRGSWSYADIIQKHYQIARAALAKAGV